MERDHTPEILRLVLNSVFVSLTLLFKLCSLPFSFLDLFLFTQVFHTVRLPGLLWPHYVSKFYLGASYTEA